MVDTKAGEAHIALIIAGGFAAIIAAINGWKWAYMEQGILAAINRTMQAILILAVVGAMLGSWMASGVIPSMMYYGIKIIAPSVFLFNRMFALLHRIFGNRLLMVYSRFYGCRAHRCGDSFRLSCLYDCRSSSFRCIFR